MHRHIESAISEILAEQIRLGGWSPYNVDYQTLRDMRQHLIQRSAIIATIRDMTLSPANGSSGWDAFRTLLQVPEGESKIFRFAEGEIPYRYLLSFQTVQSLDNSWTNRDGTLFREFSLRDGQAPTLHFLPVQRGAGVQGQLEDVLRIEFTGKHEFNLVGYGIESLFMYGVSAGIGIISKGLSTVVGLGVSSTIAAGKAETVQQDINTIIDQLQRGAFHGDFGLTAVTVTDGVGNMLVHSWASSDTARAIESLNTIVTGMGQDAINPLRTSEERERFDEALEKLKSTPSLNDMLTIYAGLSNDARAELGCLVRSNR
jgi:hypothetical protein